MSPTAGPANVAAMVPSPTLSLGLVLLAPAPQARPPEPDAASQTAPIFSCSDDARAWRPADPAARNYWENWVTKKYAAASRKDNADALKRGYELFPHEKCFLDMAYRLYYHSKYFIDASLALAALRGLPEQTFGKVALDGYVRMHDALQSPEERLLNYQCDVQVKIGGNIRLDDTLRIRAVYREFDHLYRPGGDGRGTAVEFTRGKGDVITQKLMVGVWDLSILEGRDVAFETEAGRSTTLKWTVDGCGAGLPVNTISVVFKHVEERKRDPSPGTSQDRPRWGRVRTVTTSLGVLGGLVSAGGIGVLSAGAARWRQNRGTVVEDCNTDDITGVLGCSNQRIRATYLLSGGAGLLGAGVGLIVPTIARAVDGDAKLRWAPYVGGGLLAAGAVALVVLQRQVNASYGAGSEVTWAERDRNAMVGYVGASAATGLGAGVLAGWLIDHLLLRRTGDKQADRARASLRVAGLQVPRGGGLAISGGF